MPIGRRIVATVYVYAPRQGAAVGSGEARCCTLASHDQTARDRDARIALDARPLQTADAHRGIVSYVRGLIVGLRDERFDRQTAMLLDAGLPVPALPSGEFVAFTVRRRYPGRWASSKR